MIPIRVRAAWGHVRRHPWQLALSLVGICLGVAVVVAVDMANTSARRAFTRSVEEVSGRATHRVEGGGLGLDEKVYTLIRGDLGLRLSAPVVEGFVSLPLPEVTGPGRSVRLLGVDPLSEAPFRLRTARLTAREDLPLSRLLTEPGAVAISTPLAQEIGVQPGDRLDVRAGTRRLGLDVLALLDDEGAEVGSASDLIVADVATAQEILDGVGRLSAIDLLLPEGDDGARIESRIRAALPEGARLRPVGARQRNLETMTRAFRLNLFAMSLLALVVGAFLIYNTITFSVVQRRRTIGMLRALGVTRREILALVVGEALVMGAVGSVLGVLVGQLLAWKLVDLVTQTINDLYFVVGVRGAGLEPLTLVKGLALGLGMTVAAALIPAIEASRISPGVALQRSALEAKHRRSLPLLLAISAFSGVAGWVLLEVSGKNLTASFAALFLLIAAVAVVAVPATAALMHAVKRPARLVSGMLGSLAARFVVASLSRTGVAISALMTAVAVTSAVGIMIDSFRGTVTAWLDETLRADIYVSSPDLTVGRGDPLLSEALVDELRRLPGVAEAASVRRLDAEVGGRPARLVALDVSERTSPRFDFVDYAGRTPEQVLEEFFAGRGLLASEPFAYHRGLGAGDSVTLPTDRGAVTFEILGVFREYGSDQGALSIHRTAFEEYWDDTRLTGLALFVDEDVELSAVLEAARERADARGDALVDSNRGLRERSMEIFERTFTITAVLRLLTLVVAFIGVVSALMALELERQFEIGLLRATGLTPRGVLGLVVGQTGLMGLAAGLFSVPMAIMLGGVMVHVINRRSFGWSMTMVVDPSLLSQALVAAIGAAILAGLYPAWRMSRVPAAIALSREQS